MKYIIFGSGGFAKELIDYVESDGHEIVAVVSTQPFDNQEYNQKYKVVDAVSKDHYQDAGYLLAVADAGLKKLLVEKNADRWVTFVHSKSHVSKHAKIGRGSIVCPFATVLGDSIVGEFATLNVYVCVAHNNVVGDFVTYSPYSGTMGNCSIGNNCFFGTSAYAIPGVTLAENCKLSAGSVLRKSYTQPGDVLVGNPAKPKA